MDRCDERRRQMQEREDERRRQLTEREEEQDRAYEKNADFYKKCLCAKDQ